MQILDEWKKNLKNWIYGHKVLSWILGIFAFSRLLSIVLNSKSATTSLLLQILGMIVFLLSVAAIGYLIERIISGLKLRYSHSPKSNLEQIPNEYRIQFETVCDLQNKYNNALRAQSSDLKKLAKQKKAIENPKGKWISMSGGITLHERWIKTPQGQGPLYGVRAEASDNSSVRQRLTVTRMATLGVFSLAAPKAKGSGNAYVTIEGPQISGVAKFSGNNKQAGPKAYALAAKINNAARAAETNENSRRQSMSEISKAMAVLEGNNPELLRLRNQYAQAVASLPSELCSKFPDISDFKP